jgi:ABC-type transporter Mla subunit MlaD
MQSSRLLTVFVICLLAAVPLCGQKQQREPLTEAQQDKIAEAGIDPNARVYLYTKYLNEHADVIQRLIKRAEEGRDQRIDSELQDFTALMDELASNLDTYGDRKADIRASLKPLNESIQRWKRILSDLPSRPGLQVARDDAIDACKDLAEQSSQLIVDLSNYFEEHKDQKGQDRAEPK